MCTLLSNKTAVFTFGSFNPPHLGHSIIFNKVVEIGGDQNSFIFPSVTGPDKSDKYPLEWNKKIIFLKELFPNIPFVVNNQIRNPFHAVGYLKDIGYTNIVMVVGSDRINEFKTRFRHADRHFNSFKVICGGIRINNNNNISGMSSTKARNAAKNNDIKQFKLSTGWDGDIAVQLMEAVRKGIIING